VFGGNSSGKITFLEHGFCSSALDWKKTCFNLCLEEEISGTQKHCILLD
jgi:hypothetical protein